jgi:hypothetical protein
MAARYFFFFFLHFFLAICAELFFFFFLHFFFFGVTGVVAAGGGPGGPFDSSTFFLRPLPAVAAFLSQTGPKLAGQALRREYGRRTSDRRSTCWRPDARHGGDRPANARPDPGPALVTRGEDLAHTEAETAALAQLREITGDTGRPDGAPWASCLPDRRSSRHRAGTRRSTARCC